MILRLLALVGLVTLAGCAANSLDETPEALGDFRLGYNIVQARDVEQGPFSREATKDELTTALADAVEARLGRYDGDGLYHLGIAIGGYVLALPGLPVIYTPKSALIFEVNVYDNATQQRLNAKPHRITAFEGVENIAPIVGSGLVRGKEEQLENLATDGARALENWLIRNAEWFTPEPGQTRVEFDRDALDAQAQAAIAARP
ncbi:hypothetical protein SAMN04488012_1102 [Palleronia salina]|mgnify:CR=1 FL=1|uniref:DUF4136 domain-containing protein n=2 Tax=Palleronia TaxID=315422 RepID=A0A1M6JJF1_9RHOB|nr:MULTISPECIES: hypothetical protein [Palleronia]SEM96216.1 hypothetical protein SAMN04488011_1022 [Palleronia pelagia]SHJ46848.1 hypothetical protein SAMN04488012_1102 [Palleronia salina]